MEKRGTIRLPNFLIVGMSRCGTTSLYHYLKEHPEVANEIDAKIRANSKVLLEAVVKTVAPDDEAAD